jgi:antitoxin (DNA-binding transcriptional repressor) of toxin-antitoxin stability system
MGIIGLKELRQNMDDYISRVKQGNSFIVMKKSQAIFKIVPLEQDESWETVIDFSKLKKGGVNIQELLTRL